MIKGNVTHATSGMIIHGCNAQGVMGSGVAKAIRNAYPRAYDEYRNRFLFSGLEVGDVVYSYGDIVIANAITQEYYGGDGKLYLSYEGLDKCFRDINEKCIKLGIKSIHFPKIGAGLAGGDWNRIEQIIHGCISDTIEKNLWVL